LFFLIFVAFDPPTLRSSEAASLPVSTVIVEVTGPPQIGAVALTVVYDERLVAFEGVMATGVATGAMVMPNPQPEQGLVKVGLIKADGFDPGEVMRLTFRIVGSGVPDQAAYQVTALTVTDLSGRVLPETKVVLSVQNNR
jgi:hypothetical protein